MRKSIKVTLLSLTAFGLTHCGSGPRGAKHAEAVQAKLTGQTNVAGQPKASVKGFRLVSAISADVKAENAKLLNLDYDGLNDTYTVKGRIKNFYAIPAEERSQITTILTRVDQLADEMIAASFKLKPSDASEVRTNGEVLKARARHGIASMKQRDESERTTREAMPVPDSQLFIGL